MALTDSLPKLQITPINAEDVKQIPASTKKVLFIFCDMTLNSRFLVSLSKITFASWIQDSHGSDCEE